MKKAKFFMVKECHKFHLNKVVRTLTQNEISFLQKVSHPHIHSPIEMFEDVDKTFLIFSEIEGPTILDLVN